MLIVLLQDSLEYGYLIGGTYGVCVTASCLISVVWSLNATQ